MNKSKWADYLFTIVVRMLCGFVFGGLVGLLVGWKAILRMAAHNDHLIALLLIGLCASAGALIAAVTVPRWQTPWYKRAPINLENPAQFEAPDQDFGNHRPPALSKSLKISVVGEDGQRREYTSWEEVPPEIRNEIQELEKRGMKKVSSTVETSPSGDTLRLNVTRETTASVFKITDPSGAEKVYHSLEEMPPEIRAAVEASREGERS